MGARLNPRGGSKVDTMVGMRGLEPPRAKAHYVLNVARLPIPPHPRLCYSMVYDLLLQGLSCYDYRYEIQTGSYFS